PRPPSRRCWSHSGKCRHRCAVWVP
ncbi:MAG: hypothetical protein D6793_01970, partial [Thermoflexia bacterium]